VDQPLIEVMCLNNTEYMAANASNAQAVVDQSRSLINDYTRRSAIILNQWIDLLKEAA
jgi:hypothetical protein